MTPGTVLVAIVHFQTPALLEAAVRSFREVYPEVDLLLVDNGSADGSAARVRSLADETGARAEILPSNRYHGPAMDHVLRTSHTETVFFLDSDTVTKRGGFLEPMYEALASDDQALAAGKVVRVDRRGFAAPRGTPVPHSAYMMVRRDTYLSLPPFIHHGLPVLGTCRDAHRRGLRVVDFPVDTYVDHLGRGTADRFGYGLGLRSRLDYLLHRLGF